MSCHNIGRGMNNVVKKVFELYDNGEISKEAAVKVIRTARQSVWFCDGNEPEAVDDFKNCRCGRCLKKIRGGERIYSAYSGYPDFYKYCHGEFDKWTEKDDIAYPSFCEDCLKKVYPKEVAAETIQEMDEEAMGKQTLG